MNSLSHVRLFMTPWTVAYQASPSTGFSRQELEWVALSFSRDLPNPGLEPGSPSLQADALASEPPGKPWYTGGRLIKKDFRPIRLKHHIR